MIFVIPHSMIAHSMIPLKVIPHNVIPNNVIPHNLIPHNVMLSFSLQPELSTGRRASDTFSTIINARVYVFFPDV